jgi:hypothetical protein
MSFSKPYQKSTGKTVHRSSRKANGSATVGFLNPKRYAQSKTADPYCNRCGTTHPVDAVCGRNPS